MPSILGNLHIYIYIYNYVLIWSNMYTIVYILGITTENNPPSSYCQVPPLILAVSCFPRLTRAVSFLARHHVSNTIIPHSLTCYGMTLPCSLMIYLLKYWCTCIGMFNYQYGNISEVLATNQPSKHVKKCWFLKFLLQKWLCLGGPSMATMASVCCSDCFFSSSAWPNKNSGPN